MKWFDKWFDKKCRQSWNNAVSVNREMSVPTPLDNEMRVHTEKTMTFNITKANGGWVIEHRQYDIRKDRNNNSVHIITDDKDLGQELSKIITYENIRI